MATNGRFSGNRLAETAGNRHAQAALGKTGLMDKLTLFGLFAVTAMLVTYALENRSHWFIFAFAISCALGSTYGFLQGAWPFGVVEAVWCVVALRRWWTQKEDRSKTA
jgi:hypothetical protein